MNSMLELSKWLSVKQETLKDNMQVHIWDYSIFRASVNVHGQEPQYEQRFMPFP